MAVGLSYSCLEFFNPFLPLADDYIYVDLEQIARRGKNSNPIFSTGGAILVLLIFLIVVATPVYFFRKGIGGRLAIHSLCLALTPILFFSVAMILTINNNETKIGQPVAVSGLVVVSLSIVFSILMIFYRSPPQATSTEGEA
jgi:hypothetical protein